MPPLKESNKKINPEIKQRFDQLAKQWKDATATESSTTKLITHPAYQDIIAMGIDVLPILFQELETSPDHWFWALKAITKKDPTNPEDAGNLQNMSNSWIKWAIENDYL